MFSFNIIIEQEKIYWKPIMVQALEEENIIVKCFGYKRNFLDIVLPNTKYILSTKKREDFVLFCNITLEMLG